MLDISSDSVYFDNMADIVYTDSLGSVYNISGVKVYPAVNISAEASTVNVRSVSTNFCIWCSSLPVPPQINGRIEIISGPQNLSSLFNRSYRIIGIKEGTLQTRWVVSAVIDAGGTL